MAAAAEAAARHTFLWVRRLRDGIALAFPIAYLATSLIALAVRFVLRQVALERAAPFGAFCVAIGFAVGRYSWWSGSGWRPEGAPRRDILGAPRDAALGHWLSELSARVVGSVGTMSTMLVISRDQPFGLVAQASAPDRRAEELRQSGSAIEIVTEDDLRTRFYLDAPVAAYIVA